MDKLNNEYFPFLFDSLPGLESLRFDETEMNPYNLDAILAAALHRTFKKLVLAEHTVVTCSGLCKLMLFAPRLQSLRVNCSSSTFTDANIDNMFQCGAKLTELNAANLCGADGYRALPAYTGKARCDIHKGRGRQRRDGVGEELRAPQSTHLITLCCSDRPGRARNLV